MFLKIGDQAPNFSALDQDGLNKSLSDYAGKYLLLYFYPRDNTPGCTKEACNFRDSFPKFNTDKFMVVGVSTDSVDSHKRFAEKNSLPFSLLADTDHEIVESYGVWQSKKFMGKEFLGTNRTSFLINPLGKIHKIYEKVNPITHVTEVQKDMDLITE